MDEINKITTMTGAAYNLFDKIEKVSAEIIFTRGVLRDIDDILHNKCEEGNGTQTISHEIIDDDKYLYGYRINSLINSLTYICDDLDVLHTAEQNEAASKVITTKQQNHLRYHIDMFELKSQYIKYDISNFYALALIRELESDLYDILSILHTTQTNCIELRMNAEFDVNKDTDEKDD